MTIMHRGDNLRMSIVSPVPRKPWRPVRNRLRMRIGGTGSLLGFTLLVTILAACGLSGLIP